MLKELERYAGRQAEMIYMDKSGKITRRKIFIRTIGEAKITAYCYERRAPRVFDANRILAVFPVSQAGVQAGK
ncbi:hypothetical protein N0M98_04245 [Paenibacillus doosanensis]|uniref:WYL domain-containing protein n=1 Tax=Paenibacillus konkukensis TaxID=2020716 RepID=A0ABY4S143_9BACL|nr:MULTISPECIES: hypothetical protein [Paenibacillus]MCS7459341.1 hypothetical protein [Paenibacillus doosanensis]UQZ87134.1 hypothetical protein SK3146_06430 [Paenibacillus konkukensis]